FPRRRNTYRKLLPGNPGSRGSTGPDRPRPAFPTNAGTPPPHVRWVAMLKAIQTSRRNQPIGQRTRAGSPTERRADYLYTIATRTTPASERALRSRPLLGPTLPAR